MASLEQLPLKAWQLLLAGKQGGSRVLGWLVHLDNFVRDFYDRNFVFANGSRAVVTDASGELVESDVTSAEVDRLDGVDFDILDLKPYYGGMYQYEAATTITVASAGVDYIVTGMTAGSPLAGVTFSSNQLTIVNAGVYEITYSITMSCGTANQNLEAVLYVNTTARNESRSEAEAGTANKFVHVSGGDQVSISANDTLELRVKNETAANDIDIEQADVRLFRLTA